MLAFDVGSAGSTSCPAPGHNRAQAASQVPIARARLWSCAHGRVNLVALGFTSLRIAVLLLLEGN